MKKVVSLTVCILIYCLAACSVTKQPTDDCKLSGGTMLNQGDHYKIFQNDEWKQCWHIYNQKGELVREETTDYHPMSITENGGILNIHIGMGTGLAVDTYYSLKRNSFSEEYTYVAATSGELVAFISAPQNADWSSRKLVVRNIFDNSLYYSLYYKEFNLSFAEDHTPIKEASFNDDNSSLYIMYMSNGGTENEVNLALK